MIMARNWVVAMKIEGSGWLGLIYVLEVQPFNFKDGRHEKRKIKAVSLVLDLSNYRPNNIV